MIKSLSAEVKYQTLNFITNCKQQPLILFLFTCIVFLTVTKLSLIGNGFLTFPDEFRYLASGKALQNFFELEIKEGFNNLFSTKGRPGDAILKMIPVAIQYLTANIFELNCFESNNSHPLFLFNFFIHFFILLVLFKFSKFILKDYLWALICVLLFSSLTNSYIYLRHALPYDASLLIFLLTLYKIALNAKNHNLNYRKSFLFGIFSFLGFLVYPGYISLYAINLFMILIFNINKTNFSNNIFQTSFFIIGSIFSLFLFEIMSRLGGRSYILDSIRLSGTITQGSFEESFTFIIKYLIEVEYCAGVIILISLIFFYHTIFYHIINKTFKQHSFVILLGIALLVMFLTYASAGYFLHKVVFYGRLLHQYFPLICILSVFSLSQILKNTKSKDLVLTALSIIYIINYGVTLFNYHTIYYPRDIGWVLSKTYQFEDIKEINEYPPYQSLMPSKKKFVNKNKEHRTKNIIALNMSVFWPINDLSNFHPFYPDENYTLINSIPYFLNYKAYQYEGYNIDERQNLDKLDLQIKIFQNEHPKLN